MLLNLLPEPSSLRKCSRALSRTGREDLPAIFDRRLSALSSSYQIRRKESLAHVHRIALVRMQRAVFFRVTADVATMRIHCGTFAIYDMALNGVEFKFDKAQSKTNG